MSSKREQYELAAKAAGFKLNWEVNPEYAWVESEDGQAAWNPDGDGGDALALAGMLDIRVEPSPRGCTVLWPTSEGRRVLTVLCSVTGLPPQLAACAAIFRAAVEIGSAQQ